MSNYRIWFKASQYEEFELPVNPQEVSITYPANPTQYDVEGIGEIIVPRLPKLATVTFESFFPREKMYQTMINSESWYTPEWYVKFFRNMQTRGTPFELTIIRGYDENKPEGVLVGDELFTIDETIYFNTVFDKAVLLDFTITDKGGEPGDIYYNMSISEYRDASPQSLSEVSKQTYDEKEDIIYSQERVICPSRPPQVGEITVDSTIIVNGQSYEDPQEGISSSPNPNPNPDDGNPALDESKKIISQVERRVARVLPPQVAKTTHSIYVAGLGWVNKKDCSQPDVYSNAYGIKRLIIDNV